jgi:hypothetical protein
VWRGNDDHKQQRPAAMQRLLQIAKIRASCARLITVSMNFVADNFSLQAYLALVFVGHEAFFAVSPVQQRLLLTSIPSRFLQAAPT